MKSGELKKIINSGWEVKSDTDLRIKLSEVLIERREKIVTGQGYTDNDRILISAAKMDFAYDNVQQIDATFDAIKGSYEATIDRVFGPGIPLNSDERIAVFSMTYHGTLNDKRKKALLAALDFSNPKDTRAEFWYVIRYTRQGASEPWRGYMEST
jgi:hypothetical protein